jgi:hypothetical protein
MKSLLFLSRRFLMARKCCCCTSAWRCCHLSSTAAGVCRRYFSTPWSFSLFLNKTSERLSHKRKEKKKTHL